MITALIPRAKHPPRRLVGFTLIELLVVITIIGILMSLLLPAVQNVREAARGLQCRNNLKQISLALNTYHTTHGTLPYGSGSCCNRAQPASRGGVWSTMILPHLEYGNLHDRIDFTIHHQDLPPELVTSVIEPYICPSDAGGSDAILDRRFSRDNPPRAMGLWYTASMGPTIPDRCVYCSDGTPSPNNWCCQGNNFGTNPGNGYPAGSGVGMFMRYHKARRFAAVRDGVSNTIMIGETLPRQCSFFSAFAVNFNVSPTNIPINSFVSDEGTDGQAALGTQWWQTSGFKSQHPGGANFAMGDGSVHFINETIDFRIYNALGTIAGREVASLP